MNKSSLAIAGIAAAAVASSANAAGTFTQSSTANPFPDFAATFDEPGIPVAPTMLPTDYYASQGMTYINSGALDGNVDDYTALFGFPIGTGYSYFCNFGINMEFAFPITGLDMQFYDPSGAPNPISGGAVFVTYNNGNPVDVWSFTPAWGGVGDEWLHVDIPLSDGIDAISVFGNGFTPTGFADNISWAPTPGSLALLGLGGVVTRRRRA